MKGNIISFLRTATPFLAVLFLWRLSTPFWNPAGMLALIPIFYCTFIHRVPWFAPYAAIFCFLIDYKSDMLLYWTSIYCLCYAVYGFQSIIDFGNMPDRGWRPFLVFWGVALLICTLAHFGFANLLKMLWLFVWGAALYVPAALLIERTQDDR